MLKTFRRLGRFAIRLLIVALCGFGTLGITTVAHGQVGGKVVEVDLPAQPLQSALRTLTDQYGMQILFNPNDVKGLNTPAIKGKFSSSELLEKLVDGTNLVTSVNA